MRPAPIIQILLDLRPPPPARREAAVVLDFYNGGELAPTILAEALTRWEEVLGDAADDQVRRILQKRSTA